jgi:hypothetical protein
MRTLQLLFVALCLVWATSACGGDGPTSPTPVTPPVTTTPPPPPPPPPAPIWTLSGSGNSAFDVPATVTRLQIRGVWNGVGTSNFIVHIGGGFTVNEILRERPDRTYEGTHNVRGGSSEIVNSSNVTWSLTELR